MINTPIKYIDILPKSILEKIISKDDQCAKLSPNRCRYDHKTHNNTFPGPL